VEDLTDFNAGINFNFSVFSAQRKQQARKKTQIKNGSALIGSLTETNPANRFTGFCNFFLCS